MRHLKKSVAILIAMLVPFALAANANAANETVLGTSNLTPISGQAFPYQAKATPANLSMRAEVSTPVSSPLVNPLKNVKFTLPVGVSFNPNNRKTPVCTDKMLNKDSALASPTGVVASCPKSIVGTGNAQIILAKVNNNPNTIKDAILIIFNHGVETKGPNKGQPKIKIYGYSEATQVGILMSGALDKKGALDVAVPVLSSDSAVRWFQFDLPGPVLDVPSLGIKVQGQDQNYVKGYCPANGKLVTKSEFVLGERDFATKLDTTTPVTVKSPDTNQDCVPGAVGKPKLKVTVKGPKAVKKGKKGAFKVTVANNGTGIAKNVKVTGTGGAKGNAGTLNPDGSKTVTVKAKVNGKKGKKVTLTFTAKGGATAKAKVKVKVK